MKKLFLFMVTLAFCLNLKAGEFQIPTAPGWIPCMTNIMFASNSFPPATSVTFTNTQATANYLYHTFQWFSFAATNTLAIGTNNVSIAIDSTIDGANWVPEYSTNLTGAGTNGVRFNLVGKYSQFRTRVTALGTNEATQGNYMGQ